MAEQNVAIFRIT